MYTIEYSPPIIPKTKPFTKEARPTFSTYFCAIIPRFFIHPVYTNALARVFDDTAQRSSISILHTSPGHPFLSGAPARCLVSVQPLEEPAGMADGMNVLNKNACRVTAHRPELVYQFFIRPHSPDFFEYFRLVNPGLGCTHLETISRTFRGALERTRRQRRRRRGRISRLNILSETKTTGKRVVDFIGWFVVKIKAFSWPRLPITFRLSFYANGTLSIGRNEGERAKSCRPARTRELFY